MQTTTATKLLVFLVNADIEAWQRKLRIKKNFGLILGEGGPRPKLTKAECN